MSRLDLRTGRLETVFKGCPGSVRGLAYHPTKPLMATACLDRFVRVYDLNKKVIENNKLGQFNMPYKVYGKQRLSSVLFSSEEVHEVQVAQEKKKKIDSLWETLEALPEIKMEDRVPERPAVTISKFNDNTLISTTKKVKVKEEVDNCDERKFSSKNGKIVKLGIKEIVLSDDEDNDDSSSDGDDEDGEKNVVDGEPIVVSDEDKNGEVEGDDSSDDEPFTGYSDDDDDDDLVFDSEDEATFKDIIPKGNSHKKDTHPKRKIAQKNKSNNNANKKQKVNVAKKNKK